MKLLGLFLVLSICLINFSACDSLDAALLKSEDGVEQIEDVDARHGKQFGNGGGFRYNNPGFGGDYDPYYENGGYNPYNQYYGNGGYFGNGGGYNNPHNQGYPPNFGGSNFGGPNFGGPPIYGGGFEGPNYGEGPGFGPGGPHNNGYGNYFDPRYQNQYGPYGNRNHGFGNRVFNYEHSHGHQDYDSENFSSLGRQLGRYAENVPVLISSVPLPPIPAFSGPRSPPLAPLPLLPPVPVAVVADVNIKKENNKKDDKNIEISQKNEQAEVGEKPCKCNDKNKVEEASVGDEKNKTE